MIVCELEIMPNIVSAHYYITVTIKIYFQVRTWGHFKKIAENRLGGDMNTISLYELPHHFYRTVSMRIWAVHNGSAKMKNSNMIKWPFSSLKIIVQMLNAL